MDGTICQACGAASEDQNGICTACRDYFAGLIGGSEGETGLVARRFANDFFNIFGDQK